MFVCIFLFSIASETMGGRSGGKSVCLFPLFLVWKTYTGNILEREIMAAFEIIVDKNGKNVAKNISNVSSMKCIVVVSRSAGDADSS